MRGSKGSFHEKQSAMPRTAGVSGNVPEEKDIKKAGSPVDCPQDKWKLLIEIQYIKHISLPKSLPICFRFVIGNEK